MRRTVLVGFGATALLLGAVQVVGATDSNSRTDARPVKQQLVGAGHWQSRRRADVQGWQIQVKRLDDDSLTGRITVVGSSLIQQGKIEGQISGTDVDGVIVGDDDVQIATFTGVMAKQRMSGTYTTADGDSGNWSWEGPGEIESVSQRAIEPLGNAEAAPAAGDQAAADAAEIRALGLVAPGED
jgi:hypothetical protein